MPKKQDVLIAELDDLKARTNQAVELLTKARTALRRTDGGLDTVAVNIDTAIAILKPLKGDRED